MTRATRTEYVCKFCGRTVVTNFGIRSTSFLPSLIDHLLIRHKDKLDEFGSIYLNDIPEVCYKIKTEAINNDIKSTSGAKTESANKIMHPGLT